MMARVGLLLAGMLTANCAPRVDDLRLDGLSAPHIGHLGRSGEIVRPQALRPIMVANLSTTRDLRSLAANHASGTYVDVVLCHGRTSITRQEARFDIVAAGDLQEETAAADPSPSAPDPPVSGSGRYRYSVPIRVRQTGGAYSGGGLGERSFAELDLMRTPVDLCLVIDTSNYGPRWRSNTVVIPAEAIRAAVAAAVPL